MWQQIQNTERAAGVKDLFKVFCFSEMKFWKVLKTIFTGWW